MAVTPPDPSRVRDALEKKFAEQQRRGRLTRRLAVVSSVLVLAAATLLAVHVATQPSARLRVLPDAKFALPTQSSGCSGVVSLGNGAFRVPITFRRVGSAAQMSVNLCLDGQGPFPFIIDTGAGTSVIADQLATRLHLPKTGGARRYVGVGCTGTQQPESLTFWSIGGLPLDGQAISALTTPGLGGLGEPMGLLGSDVLSRFGAVRFDFGAHTMTLPGSEGPAPRRARRFGPQTNPIPSSLITALPRPPVGLEVAEGPTYAEVVTSVEFSSVLGATEVAVDTGAARSFFDASLGLNLANTGFEQKATTVCSRITVPLVLSGRWSVGNVQLFPLMIASGNLGPINRFGFNGLLGLDELSRFQYAILDYAGAKLVLGPRTP